MSWTYEGWAVGIVKDQENEHMVYLSLNEVDSDPRKFCLGARRAEEVGYALLAAAQCLRRYEKEDK